MLESEAGWGQRPDGNIYSLEKIKLEEKIKAIQKHNSYECYSRPTGPIEIVVITEEFATEIHKNGAVWSDNAPGDLGLLKDSKEILPHPPVAA